MTNNKPAKDDYELAYRYVRMLFSTNRVATSQQQEHLVTMSGYLPVFIVDSAYRSYQALDSTAPSFRDRCRAHVARREAKREFCRLIGEG